MRRRVRFYGTDFETRLLSVSCSTPVFAGWPPTGGELALREAANRGIKPVALTDVIFTRELTQSSLGSVRCERVDARPFGSPRRT